MKAKDLAKELLKNPDFEVDFSFSEEDGSEYGVTVRSFIITGIGDIRYFSKLIRLDGEEED